MKKIMTLFVFSLALLFGAQNMQSQNIIANQKASEKANELRKVVKFNKAKLEDVYQAYKTYETGLQTLNESTTTKHKPDDKTAVVAERRELKKNLNARLQQIFTPEEFEKYKGFGAQ